MVCLERDEKDKETACSQWINKHKNRKKTGKGGTREKEFEKEGLREGENEIEKKVIRQRERRVFMPG